MALCHLSFFPFPPRPHLCASLSFLKRDACQFPLQGSISTACYARKSSGRGKESRAVKSNEELRSELREFISALGFPDDHVPSTKELTDHGRKDLANIVRRRGYKVIAELLKNSTTKDDNTKLASAENHVSGDSSKDEISDNKATTIQESAECTSEPFMSPREACMNTPNGSIALFTCASDNKDPTSSIESLRTKAAKFVLTGELDNLDENGMLASEHAPLLVPEQSLDRGDTTSCDELTIANLDENFTPEMLKLTHERQNQAEIDRLKDMLNQKELELSHLKEQIEKEKAALSFLEAKVSTEISKAEEIISAKDIELRAAEETLSGLKEVLIEYWAIAETVEVAGSFNGWQHHIIMDLQPSSELEEPTSRKRQLWSTILWLYPGIYEIKFIVDGQWRIDSKLNIINSGGITNNILRVDR
ncbi:protein PTST homolog 3, chloroplastic isoform X1 [Dioscorea cayenensis subsp. rotundata]|uniref:Protein PTST homolog 3, chloroplastic isoform X1 n=1 Tax=Dioscorea cayennensis subsp. rotundata TaxID=55577 RepID=A0AB40CV58_DIOCR|nr:protein PTST homolog 3, chloroplastic isoform X1 [Dioscorea cayenensis subsp. rotundata]XP_039142680.1 protein PTST homolog 3, chloroplastic isoform X1 [Dioscorea cayenensis subsp. rotundata]XP_039142687.1 protein PTST homolog 3, chloroplastic isoform X1 [Dioscorea cayenensis subsp. rotundata]XP_039142696.1 protein PTST homolog 3, chloroplastic isoform X1 [Dioscorea cayenensis subsp. rotundata]